MEKVMIHPAAGVAPMELPTVIWSPVISVIVRSVATATMFFRNISMIQPSLNLAPWPEVRVNIVVLVPLSTVPAGLITP